MTAEGAGQPELKAAKLTGRSVDVGRGRIMWECQCPECQGPQWAYAGQWSCIYCDTLVKVQTLRSVTPVNLPEPRPEETGQ